MQHVANKAHATADKLIAGLGRCPENDFDVARTACWLDGFDPDSREGQFYIERMVGHFANVAAGTPGW